MIVQRSRAAERAMIFDVKQFKSLEGFLESGPQFILQSYILLRNDKYDIDLNAVSYTHLTLPTTPYV